LIKFQFYLFAFKSTSIQRTQIASQRYTHVLLIKRYYTSLIIKGMRIFALVRGVFIKD